MYGNTSDEYDGGFNEFMGPEDERQEVPAVQHDDGLGPLDLDDDLGLFTLDPEVLKAREGEAAALRIRRLEGMLTGLTDAHISNIAQESVPKDNSNRRRCSLTLTCHLRQHFPEEYNATLTDIINFSSIIAKDVSCALRLSEGALVGIINVLNAVSSGRVFAAASRVSQFRCDIRTRCTTPEDEELFNKRFCKIVRRGDEQIEERKKLELERTIKRQDTAAQIRKSLYYKLIEAWFDSGNSECLLVAVMASSGLRFSEVVSPKIQLLPFADFMASSPDALSQFGDNVPEPLIKAAQLSPDRYLVNVGQKKKKSARQLTCIRPVAGMASAAKVYRARNMLLAGKKMHNRSVNRRLLMSGGSLKEDFAAVGRTLSSHGLRGAYVACCVDDMKPAGCGHIRFVNAILAYEADADGATSYDVCECI